MKQCCDIAQKYVPYDDKSHHWPQVVAVIAAAIGALGLGALGTWTSPSIPILTSNASHIEPISLEAASYLGVIPCISIVLASPILALIVDNFGRKKALLLCAVSHALSWLLIALADDIIILYIARFVEGFGDAIVFAAVPIYIGEVTEPTVRSTWGNLFPFCGFFGQFVVNAVGAFCDIPTTALILMAIPITQFVLILLVPESPYFLIMKDKHEEARSALRRLKWRSDVEEEFAALIKSIRYQTHESGTLKDLFVQPTNRKTLLTGIGIRFIQQFSGLAAFAFYTQSIFQQAGTDLSASTCAMIFTGLFSATVTGFSLFIGRCGRKPMMTISCLGCGLVLIIETAYFYVYEKTAIDTSSFTWLPLGGMLLYVFCCSAGLSTIPTVMLGELFSANIKGKALSVLNICTAIIMLSVAKLFPTLMINFGMYVPFGLFTVCCFIGVVFCYYFVPETKGKTLEEIQRYLRGDKEVTMDANVKSSKNAIEKY